MIPNNLFFLDNERILYPVGKHYTIHNLVGNTMNFIVETEQKKIITPTFFNVSPDKKYFAVCEVCEDDIAALNWNAEQNKVQPPTPEPPVPRVSIYSIKNSNTSMSS